MVWQDGGLGADCSRLHNSPGLPGLFLRSRSHTTSSEYWLFSFPLWLLLTVQWPNKGNQICFYLDVSRHSVRFREHLRRSLFQGGGFLQYHRASVCWSMCTSTTALGIMSWTELKRRNGSPAVSDHTVWELPKTKPQEHSAWGDVPSCWSRQCRLHQCLCAAQLTDVLSILFVCWII